MKTYSWPVFLVFFLLSGCISSREISQLHLRLSALEKDARALQQDAVSLDSELKQLNALIEQYQQSSGGNQQTIRSQIAGFYANLDKLNDEVQILYGKSEEAEHLSKQITGDIDDRQQQEAEKTRSIGTTASVNRDRLERLEVYLGFEASDPLDFPIAADRFEEEDLSEKERYRSAKQAFDRGDLEAARQGFQKLLKQFPTSDSADNAQFWIGESYYREEWYEKAILEYQKVIERYPKGNKVPASLLKQGLAFHKLRDKPNARLILNELIKKFPKSNETTVAKKKLREFK